jgi:hypothetical protein
MRAKELLPPISNAVLSGALRGMGALLAVSLTMACERNLHGPDAGNPADAAAVPVDPSVMALPREDASPEEVEPPVPSPLATTCQGVSLVISSVTVHDHYVDARVALRNDSSQHVPLMLTGDGSSDGRRNPTLTFALSPKHIAEQAGCGNMNRLEASDFVFLAPGERRELQWAHAPTPSKSGTYTLRATYENDPKSDALGGRAVGPKMDRLLARVRKTVPCTLVSNTVSFTWTQPEAPKGGSACTCQAGDPLCSCR